MVGKSLGSPLPFDADPVITGIVPVVAAEEPPPVMVASGEGPVVFAVVPDAFVVPFAEVASSVADVAAAACEDRASDRLGSEVSSAARVVMAKNESATAESSGSRENLMMQFICKCFGRLS